MVSKIKRFIDALSSFYKFSKLDPSLRKIVFYAEDSQSKNYLIDLIEELTNNENKRSVTSLPIQKIQFLISQKK